MIEALESEAHEGATNNILVSDALPSPTLKSKVYEGADPETHAGQSHVHTSEAASFQECQVHIDKEASLDVCRICQCFDADEVGETALKLLSITLPTHAIHQSPDTYEDTVLTSHVDKLIELGCACKNDLALAHYACALRWFVSRVSEICEICGIPVANVSFVDLNKVLYFLKGKNALQQSHFMPLLSNGDNPTTADHYVAYAFPHTSEDVVELMAWFDPVGTSTNLPRTSFEQVIDVPDEASSSTSLATKWAVEVAGILIATGLLTVTITWLLSSRVDKSVARRGVNLLLGGLCALSVVVFLRFGVLPRIKYGPARYWAILVVFWFLVFGVWASTTRSSRSHT